MHNGGPYLVLGIVAWVAFLKSGIDPIVVGLAMGLLTIAYPAAREDLERATDLFRVFREQPTSELQQSARAGLRSAISPNERWQQMFHPFTSYVVVPLFALANAGFVVSGSFLSHAYGSAITLGIIAAYVVGKPIGVTRRGGAGDQALARPHPPAGGVGVGAGRRRGGRHRVHRLAADRVAGLQRPSTWPRPSWACSTTLVVGPAMSWAIICVTYRLPKKVKLRLLIGRGETIVDLAPPVDPERDHIRGPAEASVTLVEYGDLECPYCGQAEPVIRELLSDFGDLRYVWRHLPLNDVHPHAQLAAEASEAAAAQDKFWEMHDLMLAHQDELTLRQIMGHAAGAELDMESSRSTCGSARARRASPRTSSPPT